jgi:hypothetical protein
MITPGPPASRRVINLSQNFTIFDLTTSGGWVSPVLYVCVV